MLCSTSLASVCDIEAPACVDKFSKLYGNKNTIVKGITTRETPKCSRHLLIARQNDKKY